MSSKKAKPSSSSASFASAAVPDCMEDLDFEDPYEDEIDEFDQKLLELERKQMEKNEKKLKEEDEEDDEEDGQGKSDAAMSADSGVQAVWRPTDGVAEDEKLDYDSTAYTALHRLNVEWPALSFCVLPDSLGQFRTRFPQTMYLAMGSQADAANKNKITILKVSDLHRTRGDADSESDDDSGDDSDADLDDDPIIEEKSIPHQGGINRIKLAPNLNHILATMSETRAVHIWSVGSFVQSLDHPGKFQPIKNPNLFTFNGHADEGWALQWSPLVPGRMLSGDNRSQIYLWEPLNNCTSWKVDQAKPFKGHSGSIEDLQWSPSEDSVFASCSSDRTIRMWDLRSRDKCAAWIAGHKSDVNVIDWNPKVQNLLVSGGDDGQIKVWDLRFFKSNSPAASFKWHTGPITSVEWHPQEESILVAASEDNSISIWDMSLESDPEEVKQFASGAALQEEVPPQLFFVHRGQSHIKEIHWHKQIVSTIISTAQDGINIFKPHNLEEAGVPNGEKPEDSSDNKPMDK